MKVSGSKYIFLVLYVDDVLFSTNDIDLLVETKQFLFSHFEMKDLGKHLMSWVYRNTILTSSCSNSRFILIANLIITRMEFLQ